ncbi:MAG: inositol monophosphatase [Candidatus Dormibacteraeota bacterium]|uniref:Inositol-1-monophosphatase n=1 Tax=Candidatus Dormiibacter inghamiae TaxID=3127013 RepID=A0A934NE23_9BACT|nr:inositol monophosphatase [Candidatus Dormibacteraeota bacterium]MBJ7607534.1 inositol monophosphatase [Candidatus Dormibacteraeota bacterium]
MRRAGLSRRTADVKAAGDYVTRFDRASEEAILEVLATGAPGIPVLAEESGGSQAETRWAVDPLDGTTNFTRGLPLVAVSVALIGNGLPEVGVIIGPWLSFEAAAERGGDLLLNGERLDRRRDPAPDSAVLATGFPFRRKDRLQRYEPMLAGALRRFEDLRRPGAAALDLGWTATGALDGFFELGLGTWDVAAGACLVLAAGGRVSDWSGGEQWLRSGDILAGPPQVHEVLLELAQQSSQR